jgi:hypothetical protein
MKIKEQFGSEYVEIKTMLSLITAMTGVSKVFPENNF